WELLGMLTVTEHGRLVVKESRRQGNWRTASICLSVGQREFVGTRRQVIRSTPRAFRILCVILGNSW
ncbi:hypothetical protein V5O48_012364, partial [Marasmius crinis-equi]